MSSVAAPSARRLLRPLALMLAAGAVTAALAATAAPAAANPGSTVVGTLVQAWPEQRHDEAATQAAEPLSWVQRSDGTSVRVSTADVADVPAGSTVRLTVGAPAAQPAEQDTPLAPALDVVDTDVLRQPVLAAAQAGPLTDPVTVVLAYPETGRRDGATLAQVVEAVNGPVARFWSAQTGGAMRLGVTAAHDWLPVPVDCSNPGAVWTAAASAVGFAPGPGRHLLVYLSSNPAGAAGCPYALGEVGSALHSGGSLYVRDTLPAVIAHEFGHNFGLGHSSAQECDRAVDAGSCRVVPYRDYYDVMGASWEQIGSLSAPQAARLGVLPAGQRVDVRVPGTATYALAPLAGSTGVRAIRLVGPSGDPYWLEYRAPVGQDAWLGTSADRFGLQAGVLLRRGGNLPDTSLLLDGTPGPAAGLADDLQAAVPPRIPIRLAGGSLTVTVTALQPGAATVTVSSAGGAAVAPVVREAGPATPGRSRPHAAPADEPAPAGAPPTAAAAPEAAPPTAAADPDAAAPTAGRALHESAAVRADGGHRPVAGVAAIAAGALLGLTAGIGLVRRRRGTAR